MLYSDVLYGMSSRDRIDELRDVLASYGDAWTFTDPQEPTVGDLPPDEAVDHDLRDVVAAMRERHPFESSLHEAALTPLVRRFYAGDGDERLATVLGTTAETVRVARFDLHLFRPDDGPRDEYERERMRAASRVGHRWNAAFEAVLSEAGYPVALSWNPLHDVLSSTDEGENVGRAN